MHRHQRSLLTAVLAAASLLAASPAGAQRFQQTASTPTTVVVNVGGAITWIAKEVKWPNGAPAVAAPKVLPEGTSELRSRIATRRTYSTIELIGPTSSADTALARWAHAARPTAPTEVTLTLMNASGTPVLKYLLHRAVPTKLAVAQLDAGASQIPLTHLTLSAQSIEIVSPAQ